MTETKQRRTGAYAKLLANYASDDAVIDAGEAAELLFVRGLAFLATSDSDGYITDAQVARYVGAGMKNATARARRLVEVGLWERVEGGYLVRSWTKIHETAEQKGRRRKADRERKKVQNPDGIQTESARNPEGIRENSVADSLSLIQSSSPTENLQSNQQSIAPKTESARKPDELFDAVASACGIDPATMTNSGRGAMNAALKDLRSVGATPAQVTLRARNYRERFREAPLTPPALTKHWGSLGNGEPSRRVNPMNELSKANRP